MRNVLDLRKQTGNDVPPAGWPFSKWTEDLKEKKNGQPENLGFPNRNCIYIYAFIYLPKGSESRLLVWCCYSAPKQKSPFPWCAHYANWTV